MFFSKLDLEVRPILFFSSEMYLHLERMTQAFCHLFLEAHITPNKQAEDVFFTPLSGFLKVR